MSTAIKQIAVIYARVSSEEQGFPFSRTPRQAPEVITITFAIRWRNEPGHTVYRLCRSVGEEPASSDEGPPQAN
jgi:hypothetical protein